ncbi:hypothetical protein QG516_01905 [Pedobacter gandavensis]|uniref:hypothetical protein n=1 Tax=Pedobacter TaxID=84567 RepID=UPI001C9A194D|nr:MULTISPECIES: hypothetical protein [Pedobacter]WGQ10407.1 hypothetical protein QG516_01905 [Pedobacter gandavensis]
MDLEISFYEQQSDGKYFTHRASYAKNGSKRILLKPGKMESIPNKKKFISKKIAMGSKI